ncbi:MAG: acyl-CoA dehydrogenase family protein [Lachnospiraceae bacterium]|nr:acyl-CoA dehydrogenase family protein [Lachnospiraceae bacterium]
MMDEFDFMLSEDQIDLRNVVRDWSQNKVMPACQKAEIDGNVPDELVREAFDMGLHLVTIPEEYGGLGMSNLTHAILREEVGRADGGFASRVFGFGWEPFEMTGTEEQKHMVADALIPGGIIGYALTEETGSDAVNMKTTAKKVGNQYVINGTKTFISNADSAEFFVLFAFTDKEKGPKGMTAFLLPKDAPGLTRGLPENKMGNRCVHVCSLFLDDVVLDEKYRLGEEGQGYSLSMNILHRSRPCAAAVAVGIAEQALQEAIKYAKERVVFGRPIWQHEGIGFLLADMDMRVQQARQLVWAACKSLDAGIVNKKLSSEAKCAASDAAMFCAENAVQVMGGSGYMREYPVEKLMRDAKIYQIFEGTNQIQRLIVSGQLCR